MAVQRSQHFKTLTDKDIAQFERMLTSKQVITGTDELAAVNTDWTKQYAGTSKLMLRPRTTEEVSAVLKYCN